MKSVAQFKNILWSYTKVLNKQFTETYIKECSFQLALSALKYFYFLCLFFLVCLVSSSCQCSQQGVLCAFRDPCVGYLYVEPIHVQLFIFPSSLHCGQDSHSTQHDISPAFLLLPVCPFSLGEYRLPPLQVGCTSTVSLCSLPSWWRLSKSRTMLFIKLTCQFLLPRVAA